MEGLTVAVSLAGTVAAFLLGPVESIFLFFLVIFYFPQPLTVPIGGADFSSGRFIILGVLANAFLRGHLRRFKPNAIDFWVVTGFILMTTSFCLSEPPDRVIIGRMGWCFDCIFPYIAVRLLIDDRKKLVRLIALCTASLIPLALMGIYESKTGYNLYTPFAPYFSWGLAGPDANPTYIRHGLFRASSSLGNYISFGMLFAGMAPLALGIWNEGRWGKPVALAALCGMLVGILSSMSSGPIFSLAISLGVLAAFKIRGKWPIFVVFVVACLIFVEVFSNRHFYYVLTLFSFDLETAYYRIGLIEECFGGGMAGHWLFGYGFVGVGNGNDNAHFTWEHQDLTNIYIHILARAGLVALVPFLIVNFLYYRRLYQAAHATTDAKDHWLIWCLAAALAGWNVAMMTVTALAQIETLLYIFIALCANMPAIIRAQSAVGSAQGAVGSESQTTIRPSRPLRPSRPFRPFPQRRPTHV